MIYAKLQCVGCQIVMYNEVFVCGAMIYGMLRGSPPTDACYTSSLGNERLMVPSETLEPMPKHRAAQRQA
jgi:hypothetical protein